MLAKFRELGRDSNLGPTAIFGTDSFWEGVDVAREALLTGILHLPSLRSPFCRMRRLDPIGNRFLAIGDLYADQVPDLAVANYNSDNVSVLLNQSAIPGDLNDHGCVDQSDLDILLADWGCGT